MDCNVDIKNLQPNKIGNIDANIEEENNASIAKQDVTKAEDLKVQGMDKKVIIKRILKLDENKTTEPNIDVTNGTAELQKRESDNLHLHTMNTEKIVKIELSGDMKCSITFIEEGKAEMKEYSMINTEQLDEENDIGRNKDLLNDEAVDAIREGGNTQQDLEQDSYSTGTIEQLCEKKTDEQNIETDGPSREGETSQEDIVQNVADENEQPEEKIIEPSTENDLIEPDTRISNFHQQNQGMDNRYDVKHTKSDELLNTEQKVDTHDISTIKQDTQDKNIFQQYINSNVIDLGEIEDEREVDHLPNDQETGSIISDEIDKPDEKTSVNIIDDVSNNKIKVERYEDVDYFQQDQEKKTLTNIISGNSDENTSTEPNSEVPIEKIDITQQTKEEDSLHQNQATDISIRAEDGQLDEEKIAEPKNEETSANITSGNSEENISTETNTEVPIGNITNTQQTKEEDSLQQSQATDSSVRAGDVQLDKEKITEPKNEETCANISSGNSDEDISTEPNTEAPIENIATTQQTREEDFSLQQSQAIDTSVIAENVQPDEETITEPKIEVVDAAKGVITEKEFGEEENSLGEKNPFKDMGAPVEINIPENPFEEKGILQTDEVDSKPTFKDEQSDRKIKSESSIEAVNEKTTYKPSASEAQITKPYLKRSSRVKSLKSYSPIRNAMRSLKLENASKKEEYKISKVEIGENKKIEENNYTEGQSSSRGIDKFKVFNKVVNFFKHKSDEESGDDDLEELKSIHHFSEDGSIRKVDLSKKSRKKN